jgi:hypothetical protein
MAFPVRAKKTSRKKRSKRGSNMKVRQFGFSRSVGAVPDLLAVRGGDKIAFASLDGGAPEVTITANRGQYQIKGKNVDETWSVKKNVTSDPTKASKVKAKLNEKGDLVVTGNLNASNPEVEIEIDEGEKGNVGEGLARRKSWKYRAIGLLSLGALLGGAAYAHNQWAINEAAGPGTGVSTFVLQPTSKWTDRPPAGIGPEAYWSQYKM